ncbi:hypothetical protein [Brevundimonas variabilis]|uniref:Uncharacterized protein n=1 Tax=Brevundimonas variabilis TaxID=74312 RepID=A0A7W9CKU9_9CAUL|nr:hypothetical protein [Brevundimonas variabilis]MBB5747406.1 hypothetical protein [Brevundimonas variabilis]
MALFLTTLREPSADHSVEQLDDGFLIRPVPGREQQFNALARLVTDHIGPFVAFPRKGAGGLYDCVHIVPGHEDHKHES